MTKIVTKIKKLKIPLLNTLLFTKCTPKQSNNKKKKLTDFLRQHLQVGHPVVFEELDAVHAIEAVIFDHVEGAVHSQALQNGAFPLGHVTLLPPGVLNPTAQQVVRVWAQGRRRALTQLSTATLPAKHGIRSIVVLIY